MLHVPTSEFARAVHVYASLSRPNVPKSSEMGDGVGGGIKRPSIKRLPLARNALGRDCQCAAIIGLVQGDGETLLKASVPRQHTSVSDEIQYVVHAPSYEKSRRLSVDDLVGWHSHKQSSPVCS